MLKASTSFAQQSRLRQEASHIFVLCIWEILERRTFKTVLWYSPCYLVYTAPKSCWSCLSSAVPMPIKDCAPATLDFVRSQYFGQAVLPVRTMSCSTQWKLRTILYCSAWRGCAQSPTYPGGLWEVCGTASSCTLHHSGGLPIPTQGILSISEPLQTESATLPGGSCLGFLHPCWTNGNLANWFLFYGVLIQVYGASTFRSFFTS